ncbi:MAG: GNAT family N-acetyltransferase [Methanomassiliicoccales archaeon]
MMFVESEGERFPLTPPMEEDWEWIEETLVEAQLVSVPPMYESVSEERIREMARQNAHVQRRDSSEDELFLLKDGEGNSIGCLWMMITEHEIAGERRGFIAHIYVSPGWRERGLAKALMRFGEEWTSFKELRAMGLAVSADNERAVSLYRSMGYEVERMGMSKEL